MEKNNSRKLQYKAMKETYLSQIKNIAATYGTDAIFILGKGPSADNVPTEVYTSSLVIGLNDSERIYPVDISIFHAEWVKNAISDCGQRAKLYLTSTDFKPKPPSQVSYLNYERLNQDTSDLMIQRLLTDNLVLQDVLFMSALQIARIVSDYRNRRQKVYMIGFDFRAELGNALALGRTYAPHNEQHRRMLIGMQENFFLNALYCLRESEIEILHVGERLYSRITESELCEIFLPNKRNKKYWGVSIVAELTTNHFGDRGRLERMVYASKAAGADYIKVQKRDVEQFYSVEQLKSTYRSPFGSSFRDYRLQLELDGDDFMFLNNLCEFVGIGWFASALDEKSYLDLIDYGSPMIKLPSTISEHRDYLTKVAKTSKCPLVLSTGMTDKAYEQWMLETFANVSKLYLLQCNSAYPTPIEDCNVGVVRHYDQLARSNSRIIPGYSSHDDGWFSSALAVAAGARMVEKHVKLGNTEWAHFDAVALDLTTSAFKDYVDKIRQAELAIGSEIKQITPCEHHKY